MKISHKNIENISFLEIDIVIRKQDELITFIKSKI